MKEREELFLDKDTVYVLYMALGLQLHLISLCRRPGILVLINDTDWELEGEKEYILREGDEVVFISTLHGG